MKIRYLSTLDVTGGAAQGAHRLHRGLKASGVDCRMLVCRKDGDDPSVDVIESPAGFPAWEERLQMERKLKASQVSPNPTVHSLNCFPSGLDMVLDELGADVLQFHWIGSETISIEEMGRLRTPVVWRLADQWAFCGAEHYMEPGGTERFREGYLEDNRPPGHSGVDLDRWTWERKRHAWRGWNPVIVAGSHWLGRQARESILFRDKRVEVIPSGVETDVFRPLDKTEARQAHGLPLDKHIVLFSAMNAASDKRKGFDLLVHALREAASAGLGGSTELAVLGDDTPENPPDFGMPCHYLGRLKGDEALARAYSAADVAVAPSRLDNLPFTVMEALACGVPCCAFNVGGIPDMVEHRENGWLAPAYDTADLACGLAWILDDPDRAQALSRRARTKVEQEFGIELQAARYIKLYNNIPARRPR